MAVITRLAVHLVAKNLPLTSKEAAVVFGLASAVLIYLVSKAPLTTKGLRWLLDW